MPPRHGGTFMEVRMRSESRNWDAWAGLFIEAIKQANRQIGTTGAHTSMSQYGHRGCGDWYKDYPARINSAIEELERAKIRFEEAENHRKILALEVEKPQRHDCN